MATGPRAALEVWSPLPPQESGVADYVAEQLETLACRFELTLVVEDPHGIDVSLREQHRVVSPAQSDPAVLRLYHIGNSPLHRFIYSEAIRTAGVVVLHEWNLHELLLGFAVTAHNFDDYRQTMRREHGERGSIAAETIASALGGKHWTSVFPLNAEILSGALAVVCLSGSTAAKVAARDPGGRLLHLPHHADLKSNARTRDEARARLGLNGNDRVVVMPGLGTSAKALNVARTAIDAIRPRVSHVVGITVGGGPAAATSLPADPAWRDLGRVDLETLGDALLAADVVVALRFPSRGETSGVLMRALAGGRATVISTGSTGDEDLPDGVAARVSPGPREALELGAILEFLLINNEARHRIERLAREVARARPVGALTETLAAFLSEVGRERGALLGRLRARTAHRMLLAPRFRNELDAVTSSLGLAHLPSDVFERLARIL